MSTVIIIVVSLLEAAGFILVLFLGIAKRKSGIRGNLEKLEDELRQKSGFKEKLEALYAQLVDFNLLKVQGRELISVQESLKAERGRITITQAELETVEARLRELEEIERELEASGIETKEELKIIQKKQKDLAAKNEAIKSQIAASLDQMNKLMSEIEMTAQMQEQVDGMKLELVNTQEKIDTLLLQIEQGNEQYFILKKRYDALDIEYAQLYERFSQSEAAQEN